MPAVVGPVQIFTVSGGVVNYGDTLVISPKNPGKTVAGAGAENTGAFVVTYSCLSTNTVFDSTGADQPIVGTL
ncbi:spore germination protein [Bacillus sp. REN10]|uniref:spore germination protein n=1 Tax=Bacillus sp. REN10 TaxID=2782541 RepID=UPI00193C69C5|nr:spore germination protein [Bacillus sp. REN10]